MRLYKYIAAARVSQLLSTRRLRFTQPIYFNDPFELAPSIEGAMDSTFENRLIAEVLDGYAANPSAGAEYYREALKEHEEASGLPLSQLFPYEQQLTEMLPHIPEIMRSLIRTVNKQIANGFYSDLRERIAKSFGILSLSEIADSLLMWAHYGDEHRGAVLGFDGSHTFFNRKFHEHDVARSARPVVYTAQRPKRTLMYDPQDEGEFLESLARDFFLAKSPEWAYEREWRMLLPATGADAVVRSGGQDILLYEYPADALREIILGCRATDDLVSAVSALLQGREYHHVELKRARLHPDLFQLVIEPAID